MHPRNKHQSRYDLAALTKESLSLKKLLIKTPAGEDSLDFSHPATVKTLNQAILKSYYGIIWDVSEKFLCPPVPGRSDHIHYVADLLKDLSAPARVLDIGVGANCIYPIIGICEYGWDFVGADINPEALASAQKIIDANPKLMGKVELRLQKSQSIFRHMIKPEERFDLTICNPPFHPSAEAAAKDSARKWKGLGKHSATGRLNFGGMHAELWTEGGETGFIQKMIEESADFASQCQWFTTLVSRKENLPVLNKTLDKAKVIRRKVLEMSQGQKISRILCWSYFKE